MAFVKFKMNGAIVTGFLCFLSCNECMSIMKIKTRWSRSCQLRTKVWNYRFLTLTSNRLSWNHCTWNQEGNQGLSGRIWQTKDSTTLSYSSVAPLIRLILQYVKHFFELDGTIIRRYSGETSGNTQIVDRHKYYSSVGCSRWSSQLHLFIAHAV